MVHTVLEKGEGAVELTEKQWDKAKDKELVMVKQIERAKDNNQLLPSNPAFQRDQISYRSKLMEKEEEVFSQELEDQMKEWLCEEKEISPPLTEEQVKLLDSLPKLTMSDERLKDLCRPWKDALILTLLGKLTNLEMLKDRVAWILRSRSFELIDLPNNYFVFRTENKDLRLRLLFDGPWLIQGHYLAVQRWSPNFNPYRNKVQKVAVWVRIPTLPMHVYSEDCLLEVGNMIGKALKVDINTLAQGQNRGMMVERGKFARVSVEVDLNQALKSRFVIRSTIYTVEYEGLDSICFKCGKYGHSQEKCHLVLNPGEEHPEKSSEEVNSSHVSKNLRGMIKPLVSMPGINSEEDYGSWMIAKSNFRKGRHRVQAERKLGKVSKDNSENGMGKLYASGTRFDVLQEVEDQISSEGVDLHRKTEVAATMWKRKEGEVISSNKGGGVRPKEREKLNIHKGEQSRLVPGQSQLQSSMERGKKDKVEKVKEKEDKVNNILVGQPFIGGLTNPSQQSETGKSKQKVNVSNLGANSLSSLRSMKKAARAHKVIIGSINTIDLSKASEIDKVVGKKKKYEEKENRSCNPGFLNSCRESTQHVRSGEVADGEEDSEVVPSSL